MNKVLLIGRLTRGPELRYTQTQKAVCKFTLAVQKPGRDSGADFIKVQVWDKAGENCHMYLSKGSMVGLEGRITTGSYEKDGKTYYTTEVTADRVEFLTTATPDEKTDDFQQIQEELPF